MTPAALRGGLALAATIAALALLAINRYAPPWLHADTLLFPIMSVQHVTPFLWGQDRLANVVPWLLSPLGAARWNLAAHLAVFAASFFLLLWMCARIAVRLATGGERPGAVRTAFAIAVAASFAFLGEGAIHAFALEGQPYALSYLLLAWSALASTDGWSPGWRPKAAVLALVLAVGLNPSIVLPAAAIAIGRAAMRRDRGTMLQTAAVLGLLALSFVVWMVLPRWMGAPPGGDYFALDRRTVVGDVAAAAASILSQVRVLPLLAAASLLVAARVLGRRPVPAAHHATLAMLWLFVALWVTVFAVNPWVKANGMHFRYFFPCFLALVFHATLAGAAFTAALPPLRQAAVAVAMGAFAAVMLARPYVPLERYPTIANADRDAAFAASSDIRFIAGDYWRAWPAVFELLADGRPAYGLAYRAEGNREEAAREIDREVAAKGAVRVACLSATAAQCVEQLAKLTGRGWEPRGEGACPERCSALTVVPAKP